MADRFEFAFGPKGSAKPAARRVEPDEPFRLLLIGDFSGRGASTRDPAVPLERRPVLRVDIDNVDQVLARLAPSLQLASVKQGVSHEPPVELSFAAIEDFHPDWLLGRLELFRHLRELRSRLQDPERFAQAAAELNLPLPTPGAGASPPASGAGAASAPPPRAGESDAGAIERLLGRAAAAPQGADALIRAIVAPHLKIDTTSSERAAYVAAVDTALGDQLRSVLHAKAFQSLEANWRGLHWLIDNLELDDDLQLYLLDVTAGELLGDAKAMHADAQTSKLRQLLVDRPAAAGGARHWAALVALFEAGASDDDLTWLSALGAIGAHAGAPLLAGAGPSLLGLSSFVALPDPRDWPAAPASAAGFWQALRRSGLASWIGLAAPRLLMRQPYGARTDPVAGIAFEEWVGAPDHAQLLWGPSALGCALLLGRGFRENGWELQPDGLQNIGDLPSCVVLVDGERRLQPCAEVLLSERAAEAFGDRGIMALASYKDRAEARLIRFQSVADPAQALSGFWS
jgi:type VI secretion system protein ImpC